MSLRLIVFLLAGLIIQPSWGASRAGIITSLSGSAEVFVKPSASADGQKPRVKFEGKFYTIKRAKIGQKLRFNQVIKTGTKAKLKITFVNGDTMMLGPGTALSLADVKKAMKNKKGDGQIMNLIYGKVRSVISKNGPRRGMRVRTRTAVAGVRGTDFYVRYNGARASTEVSVLRGKVAVNTSSKSAVRSKRMLKKGYTAEIKNAVPAPKIPNALPEKGAVISQKIGAVAGFEKPIKVNILSKERLNVIDEESSVKTDKKIIEQQPAEVQSLLKELEKKSVEVVVQDIKSEDPEQYKKIKKIAMSATSVDEINQAVINDMTKKAPIEVEAQKITEDELMKNLKSGDDVYNKYFK